MLNTPNLSRHPRTSNRAEVRASATVMTRENAPMAILNGTARDINASNSACDTTERRIMVMKSVTMQASF